MLQRLVQIRLPLYVATNKRKVPTDRIIDWPQWRTYFQAIYSLDTPSPAASAKGALFKYVLQAHALPAKTTLYVGHREDDAFAADQADAPFFHATWGYETKKIDNNPGDVATLLNFLKVDSDANRKL